MYIEFKDFNSVNTGVVTNELHDLGNWSVSSERDDHGIAIQNSVSYDILNPLLTALGLSFVQEGRILFVHMPFPCPLETGTMRLCRHLSV